jgi:flavorubredoxin
MPNESGTQEIMNGSFKAVRVTDHVWWVGALDWNLREFHGYTTERGTTYNAFLVVGDAITLIDAVKAPFKDEMLARVASVCDPDDVRYIVSNHSEMDHSGCLPALVDQLKPEKVFASVNGVKALEAHFGAVDHLEAVKDGQELGLGGLHFSFYETRMLHWPDSMVTLLAEDKLLFSQDAFGMHLASGERFADEIDASILEQEARKYFANILMPFAGLVPRTIQRLGGLDFKIIAPDHGPIWREEPAHIVGRYAAWAAQRPTTKAVIVYDTMWGSTDMMAHALAEGVISGGAEAKLMPLREHSRSAVATEVLEAGALAIGSPTLNNQVFPTVADVMTYLLGLGPKNLIGVAFGSYGWSGNAVSLLNGQLDAMGIERIHDGLSVQYVPNRAALDDCRRLGVQLAEALKVRVR